MLLAAGQARDFAIDQRFHFKHFQHGVKWRRRRSIGCGVVATAILKGSKGEGGGWLLINFGWGLAVMAGVYVAFW